MNMQRKCELFWKGLECSRHTYYIFFICIRAHTDKLYRHDIVCSNGQTNWWLLSGFPLTVNWCNKQRTALCQQCDMLQKHACIHECMQMSSAGTQLIFYACIYICMTLKPLCSHIYLDVWNVNKVLLLSKATWSNPLLIFGKIPA
jgi:hypothetical protein